MEDGRRILDLFADNEFNDLIHYEDGLYLPKLFVQKLEKIKSFEVREDDIWIVTFPKCGTTWTQELVWTLVNDVDDQKGKVPLYIRSPWIDSFFPIVDELGVAYDSIDFINKMEGRRIIKTHLPLQFLPDHILEKCRVIYVARNPKDVAVSYYHHQKNIPLCGFTGSFEDFMKLFMEGLVHYGRFWSHFFGAWNQKKQRNLKFMWYEDMKTNPMRVIENLCTFLEHSLTYSLKTKLSEHVHFETMRSNPFSSPIPPFVLDQSKFFRKGLVGDWQNYFDKSGSEMWEVWKQNNINGTDLENLEYLK